MILRDLFQDTITSTTLRFLPNVANCWHILPLREHNLFNVCISIFPNVYNNLKNCSAMFSVHSSPREVHTVFCNVTFIHFSVTGCISLTIISNSWLSQTFKLSVTTLRGQMAATVTNAPAAYTAHSIPLNGLYNVTCNTTSQYGGWRTSQKKG